MKYRRFALLIAGLTMVLAVFFQLKSQNAQYRTHQHKQATVTELQNPDGTGCITRTPESQYRYDAAAVDVEKLQTHLPLVILETDEKIPGAPYYEDASAQMLYTMADNGDDEAWATMKIIDNRDTVNTPKDAPVLLNNIKIRVRGNSSRWFDKKSYAVKLVDGMGNHENKKVLGMEANHSWALHGPFLDKTLMRNYIGMNISGELMNYAPDVRFCEVILNGDYQGLYLLMETVNRGKGRINVEKPNMTRNVTGYIIELDNGYMSPLTSPNNFTKYTGVLHDVAFFDIVYPDATALTPEIKDYITKDLSRCEKALYSYDYDTKKYGFQTFMDVGEFTDYLILNEVFLQHDMGNLSTYFYKGVDGLFSPCVWDFNHSMGNASISAENDFSVLQFVSVQAPWFWMMIKEETFIDSVISRYHSLRQGILSDEEMIQYIEDTRDYLGSAVDRNFAVWGYSFDPENLDDYNKLRPLSQNPRSYDQAVEQMENTLLSRLHWLDENIEALRQYSHPSAVKKFNQ
ncbi:MAG: CotH kinase family protein [Oscillospiraceae bacterium]